MTTTVREFIPDQDLDGVAALCRWAWWPERDLAGWTWLTQAPGMAGRPLGWVCADDNGEIVGFMGNFVQERHQGPAPDSDVAPVICGHTFLVHPKAMGKARMLMRRILDQGEVAATYTFNANSRSAGFFKHFGFETWPGSGADTKLVWPVAPLTLGAERLLRRWAQARKFAGVQGGREWFSPPPAPILATMRATMRATPSVRVLDPRTDIDARFDDLWRDLMATGASLARRDAAALRWRIADPMLTRPPILLAYEADGALAGYLLAVLAKGTEIEAPALEIIDLIALPKVETVALPALVTALTGLARPLGAARVRLGLAHPRVEALLAPTRPARRKTPYSHCHVRFGRPDKAVDRDGWYATPFDGDQSFTSRPTP